MATDSGYNYPGQTYSGLPQCDSKPSISTKQAYHNRVETPPRNSEADIRDVGNSSSEHVCHSPQHTSSPVYVSSSGASSAGNRCFVTRLAGEVDPPFPLLSKAIQKIRTTQEGEVILIAPWWPSQPWFPHLLRLCVDHPRLFPYCQDILLQKGYVSSSRSYHLHAWTLSCSTTKQQDFQKRSLDSQQLLEDPLQIKTTGGYALLTGPQGRNLIRLVPQLLIQLLSCMTYLIYTWPVTPDYQGIQVVLSLSS